MLEARPSVSKNSHFDEEERTIVRLPAFISTPTSSHAVATSGGCRRLFFVPLSSGQASALIIFYQCRDD